MGINSTGPEASPFTNENFSNFFFRLSDTYPVITFLDGRDMNANYARGSKSGVYATFKRTAHYVNSPVPRE